MGLSQSKSGGLTCQAHQLLVEHQRKRAGQLIEQHQCLDLPVAQLLQKDVPAVREAVGAADVVLYSLEGCAFCATATTLLDARKIAYTAYYPKGKEVTDLKTTLGVPIMAFPAIFVRGRCI